MLSKYDLLKKRKAHTRFYMIRKKYSKEKLKKVKCEICGFNKQPKALEFHHIIPRCDPRCSNDLHNLCVICGTCHTLVHIGDITIIGCYPSTAGRTIMFFKKGETPPLEREFWKVKDNPFILTITQKDQPDYLSHLLDQKP